MLVIIIIQTQSKCKTSWHSELLNSKCDRTNTFYIIRHKTKRRLESEIFTQRSSVHLYRMNSLPRLLLFRTSERLETEGFLIAKLVHELFVELCQTVDDSWNFILLRQYCASKMPGAGNLPGNIAMETTFSLETSTM